MKIRDRIKELRRVRAGDLRPNPANWRMHPQEQQRAVLAALHEVGYVDAVIARELKDGSLELIDGHLRADLNPNQTIPVLVVDLDDADAAKALATLDPLAAMAQSDDRKLSELLRTIEAESAELEQLLDSLDPTSGGSDVKLKPMETSKPPAMAWVLIGIPTVRFGEIQQHVDAIASINDVIVETTQNDGPR